MALRGLKIIEVAGLAPAPFCGMILSDFGANVIRVERPGTLASIDVLRRGKKTVNIDLKHELGKTVFKRLCTDADVLIEPFRSGVMERLGLGPTTMMDLNKRLIYARLTGYGQNGTYATRAGHDLNYLALSGVLSSITANGRPTPPLNMLADFAGGGMTCAMGILLALYERNQSGLGQIVDTSMVEGTRYVSSYLWSTRKPESATTHYMWPNRDKKGENLLDGGAHFYTVYRTKDGRWMSVGAIEPQFYQTVLDVLQLRYEDYLQTDVDNWPVYKKKFAEVFATKTLDEWTALFKEKPDSCVEPVLEVEEARDNDRANGIESFLDDYSPKPAPRLSRTPAQPSLADTDSGQDTIEVLREIGYTDAEINKLNSDKIIYCGLDNKL